MYMQLYNTDIQRTISDVEMPGPVVFLDVIYIVFRTVGTVTLHLVTTRFRNTVLIY